MSDAYEKFVRKILEAKSYERRYGFPVEILDELTPEEKEKAELELIKRLSVHDSWPATGLGHMKSAAAVSELYELVPKASDSVKAQIATALWKICEDEKMLQVVLDLSEQTLASTRSPYYEFKLIDIIYCLAQYPQAEARARLVELTDDEKYLVAYNAKKALELRSTLHGIST